jgi:hypothetical protein
MKIVGAAAIALGFALSCSGFVSSPALAQPSIEVGPGGVRVGPDSDRYERRGRDRGGRCRTVEETRRNRFGERVTRTTRICD